jgi:hypothetical protein
MRQDRRWLIGYATIVMLITTIPYIFGYTLNSLNSDYRNNWVFTGFLLGVEDGNSYIAKELIGSAGEWLFRTPYTPLPQSGVIAFLPFILLGKLASPPGLHEQLVALFHIFRVIAGFIAILATYDFLAIFISNPKFLKLGVIIATIGGGLGWFWVLLGYGTLFGTIPLDFYSPETFGFLSLYSLPHLALARAFFLWGLGIFVTKIPNGSFMLRDAIHLGVDWLVIGIAQPISAVVFGVVLGIYLFIKGLKLFSGYLQNQLTNWFTWRTSLRLVVQAGLIPAPLIFYTYLKFLTDPYLSTWQLQNRITSPNFFHYISAYGLFLPLVILGGIYLYRRNLDLVFFLGGWVVAFPILAYLPVGVQRRLVEGVWVAIVALAMIGLMSLNEKWPGWKINLSSYTLTVISLFSTTFILTAGILAILKPGLPVLRPSEEVMAFENLSKIANRDDVILSSYETGNALPAWVNVRVVIGHGPESANLEVLRSQVANFYQQPNNLAEIMIFLRTNHIHFVFWGPEERELGEWNPVYANFLTLVYHSKNYAIFETTFTP